MTRAKGAVTFMKNIKDVQRLLKIHTQLTGTRPGRRAGVEVLNKSGILLVTACWEAYVEDLAAEAFDFLLGNCSTPQEFPKRVRVLASESLRTDMDSSRVWDLAGSGWQAVLRNHRKAVLDKHIGTFNTPRPTQVDSLFEKLIGLKKLSGSWYWPGMSPRSAKEKLDMYITLRGDIAHRVSSAGGITKPAVRDYSKFVHRIVVKSNNTVRQYLRRSTGKTPWVQAKYG